MTDSRVITYLRDDTSYPVLEVEKTGENIRNLCAKQGITVKMIQEYMGFACPQTIYRWFSGKALPTVDNLFALSRLLHVPIEHILIEACTGRCLYYDCQYFRKRSSKVILYYARLQRKGH